MTNNINKELLDSCATKKEFKELQRVVEVLDHRTKGENTSTLAIIDRVRARLDSMEATSANCKKSMAVFVKKETNNIYNWINLVALLVSLISLVFTLAIAYITSNL